MKFRTEIEPQPLATQIGYQSRLAAFGSCFSEHIAARLAAAKFRITANPTGILFNPLSVASTIEALHRSEPVSPNELHTDGEMWFHYGFHGDFSASSPEATLEAMNAARKAGSEALCEADTVLITFGTAWVFEHRGEVVANCHKQPATEFSRRRLAVDEIVSRYNALLEGPLSGKQIILTVSPVRHIGDGLSGNSISKATLRLAAETLAETHPQVAYFPAYEIVQDDLRDYRFYADDLLHPSPQAIVYIWEKFTEAALTAEARQLLPQIERIVAAATHRPRNPQSESHCALCRRQLEAIAALPQIDFGAEAAYFRRCIEINL